MLLVTWLTNAPEVTIDLEGKGELEQWVKDNLKKG